MRNEIEKFKEEILKDYPRMTLDSHFNFRLENDKIKFRHNM